MEMENQIHEKYTKMKSQINHIGNEVENQQNKKSKKDISNKDDKNKRRKINTKKSSKLNTNEKSIRKTKLKNVINKVNYLYLINTINKYFQRWILETFDIIEEESESPNDNEAIQDKNNIEKEKDVEEEEDEEEEDNDYGGDLEEIEERAPDEEESVITSVHSKTKVKRANDILFSLRKIIKYKNIFFRYFMRWYNAVDINAAANEYKKIRKEKKLSNNINNININSKKNMTNINSNLNNINTIELKNPIYEVSSEEKMEEPKSDVKINLKNFIELKGTKKTILKKYYDIWHYSVFNQENNSIDSNNNEQNEYIFTYHGNFRKKDNILTPKIKINKQNLTDDNISDDDNAINNNKGVEGYNSKTKKVNDNKNSPKKSKQKAQCYIRKKIYFIKNEGKIKNKKKIKINDILKNIFIKINNKKLLYNGFKKWIDISKKLDIGKIIFKKKQSTKIKKKASSSKNKKKSIIKKNSKDNNNNIILEEKGHKKDNLSLDEYINQKDKVNKFISDNKIKSKNINDNQLQILSSESSPIINLKKTNDWPSNIFQINSDNSINNSIITNSNTAEIIDQLKDRELKENNFKKNKKKSKKEKKDSKGEFGVPCENEDEESEMEKIKKNIEKICRIHKNKRAQRYLLIEPPKIKKLIEKKKEDRQSFSSINYSLKLEKIQKKLLKLFLKTSCRQNSLMIKFDNWFNITFDSKDYIPFIRKFLSNLNDGNIKAKRKVSKAKKIKKTGKNNLINKKEEINTKRDISADNVNLNSTNKKVKNKKNIKNIENINKIILNKFDLNEKDNKNEIYIINNTETKTQENKDNDKFDKIKELLNQDFDSESSDNKLLFKEKKSLNIKNLSESFDAPRKKSIGSNKKYKKIKSDNKDKIKNKNSKKIKEKNINKVENIEESPGQRKPGKKVQFSNNNNLYDNRYNTFEKELDIDDLGQNINKIIETIKKKKKRDLSSSVDIALNKNGKKENRILHHSRKKSNEENINKINIKGINDYFEYKSINYIKDEDINPDVQNIEITQDSDNEKKQKKMKKGKKDLNPEEKEEKKKIKLIKIYNRALHLLRKAIRSYKKRNKTFDPDYELTRAFQKWITFVSKSNIYDYKNEIKDENDEDIQEKKINALKEVFNIINIHNKKIKGRLSEDEENYNYIKWCYNIWLKNSDIKDDNNNHIENKKNEIIYYMKNKNIMNNNEIIEINKNGKDLKEKKESKKDDKNNDKKKKKHIESESLLEIDLEEKKTRKHKVKKRKINRNNNSVNSNNSSFKKEEKDFDKNIEKLKENLNKFYIENVDKQNNQKENEEIIIKNIPKEEKPQQGQINIDINKKSFEKSKVNETKKDEIKNNNINKEEKENKENINDENIIKTEESIFQKIRREFPLNNNDYCANTDYIKEKEEEDKKKIMKEEENPGFPPKIQPPPQVLALMKKHGKLNLPLPRQYNNLRLSYREFGKGNLEIVEPGELVSSERLKMVKKNLKRNLTYSTTFIEEKNSTNNNNTNKLIKSSYFKNDALNLNYDNKRNIEEINKKLYPIFEKKDEGLFNKKKYFNIWGSKTDKRKKFNISLNIRPEVKKAKNTPIIFLTKSIQEENQEENFIDEKDNRINNKKNNFEKDDINNINNIYKIDNSIQQNNDNNIIIQNSVEVKNNDEKYIKEINNQSNSIENINNNHNENEIYIKEKNININNIEKYSNKSLEIINKEEKEVAEDAEEEEEEEDEENEKEEKANVIKEKDIKNLNILNIQKDEERADINSIDETIKMEIKEKENLEKIKEYHSFIDNTKIKPIYNEEKDIMKVNINSKEKEKNIKYIYKKLKTLNKSNNCTFNFFKNNHLNNNLTNDLMKKEYSSFLDEQNKKTKAFQLYLFYRYFNENYEYYLLRNNFYKLKKNNNIFKNPLNKNHIKSYEEHCISCSCENDNISLGQNICLNCNCNEIKTIMKNILIKYKYSKDLNPIRYYFYLWFKNILNK